MNTEILLLTNRVHDISWDQWLYCVERVHNMQPIHTISGQDISMWIAKTLWIIYEENEKGNSNKVIAERLKAGTEFLFGDPVKLHPLLIKKILEKQEELRNG